MAYAGESLSKKLARAEAYCAARSVLGQSFAGGVVCLAGPQAHDVGPLRALWPHLSPDRVLFADINEAGLCVARTRLPGCHTFLGPLHEAPLPWPVSLAVLDFCGHAHGDNWRAIISVGKRLTNPGAMLLTTQRGRDPARSDRRMIKRLELHDESGSGNNGAPRSCLLTANIASGLGRMACDISGWTVRTVPVLAPRLTLWDSIAYDKRRGSPMLITVLASSMRAMTKGSVSWRSKHNCMLDELQALMNGASLPLVPKHAPAPGISPKISSETDRSPQRLLAFARQFDNDTAAGLLDVSPGTLAAWRAHDTMGTYLTPKEREQISRLRIALNRETQNAASE